MFKRTKIGSAALAALGGVLLATSAPAFSQSQTVEVTGSRIRQIDAESAQPVFKMTAEEIQKSGLVTVGDILNSMSSAGSPDFSRGSALTSNREQGGQYINLRNLGSQRLLVLVDGKRWTQSVAGYTDMSTVPSALVDRIEVLRDGASSIYGSDAIAGVVNIILKKSMQGGQASAYYGANEKGDGKQEDYSFTYGASGEKSSIMFGLSHSKVGRVAAKDREITATTYGPDISGVYSFGTGPWGRIRQVSATGGATGFDKVLNHTGGADGVGVGQNSRDPANYHTRSSSNLNDLFNSTSQMDFQSPTQLTTIFTKGSIELTKSMSLSATAMASERNSSRQIAGYPLNSLSQSSYPVYIDKDSYYNPYGNQVAGAGNGQDLFFYRRTIDVPRITENDSKTFHFDAALTGDVTLGGKPWTWSASFNFNDVNGSTTSTGNLNLPNLKRALGPSYKNAAGNIVCGTPTAPVAGCVPFDILGGPSASTKEALDYVMSTGLATYGSTIKSFNVDASGELMKLPAGAMGLAVGLEKREVSGYDQPGQFERSGLSTDLAGNPTYGKFTVNEGYAELNVPLLKDKPYAQALSVNASTRYSDYSNFGDTTNSKLSFIYRPVKDLMARGTVAEGFRAPTVGDTFGGGSQSFDSYLDPCDSVNGAAARDATVKARCTAAGVPTNFRQLNQAGNVVGAGGGQSPYPFQAGAGNADLQPETAKTKTLGLVYSPSQLPGLTASLDWYRITVDNRITAVSAGYILGQCFTQGSTSFCDDFRRDSTGQVVALNRGNANLGQLETEGFDLGLSYRLPANAWGQFAVRSETSYVKSYKIKSSATSEWVDYVGEYPLYRMRSNIGLDWNKGPWSATWGVRVYGGIKSQCWDSETNCNNPGAEATWGTDVNRSSMIGYHDLSVGYRTPWKGRILVGINNIFDLKPRIIYDANYGLGGNSSSSSVDPDLPIDRFVWVRYTQSF